MTVLSRGARVRRGGRRPGWVLLTALLVLAIGASSALVFTNRVELLKLAVILALWAAFAGAFVSVIYRRQSDADQSRVRDLKLVYDLQLDREISARREYELTVESQLRRELATELQAQAADDVATLRAELAALRTSLEILFDTDLEHRPALGAMETETPPGRAYSDWDRSGDNTPVDWVSSDRVTSVREEESPAHAEAGADDSGIIDVPEEPLLPPRQRDRPRYEYDPAAQYEAPQDAPHAPPQPAPQMPPQMAPQPEPEPRYEPRHHTPPPPQPEPQPGPQGWQPIGPSGQWLPPGMVGSNWAGDDTPTPPPPSSGRRRRYRDSVPDEPAAEGAPQGESAESDPSQQYGDPGRRARSRHSAEFRDYGVRNFVPVEGAEVPPPFPHAPAAAPSAGPPPHHLPPPVADGPPPPRLAPRAPAPRRRRHTRRAG
ncbi:membrane protein [Mycobacterium rhizamassiliense]|uniref:Membrane protein n=1 Tax=Mycobacterium rhizamassiliense TaxID=1841860 RepID=A0A2U3NRT3_9MYCO|nr:membrane protein [Mycobacterium rhizamassiliense]